MLKTSIKPSEVIQALQSPELSSLLSNLTNRWGIENFTEDTTVAISHAHVLNSIYLNKDRDPDMSRPFIREFPHSLEEPCPFCEGDSVRADLALITREGEVLLWVEIKLVTEDAPLRESRISHFKCDIWHSSLFESSICIVFFDDVLSLMSRRDELTSYAKERGVNYKMINIG